uniref:Phosphofurin acidic cluster sorting protein 2 n=1 Tax=Panagrolaimus davidi TaxID=227884 RepID=A0A914PMC9_9BILA
MIFYNLVVYFFYYEIYIYFCILDYGTVHIVNCQSQAIETSEAGGNGGHKISPKDGGLSEEEDDDDTEESDFEVQDDDGTPRYGQPSGSKTRRTRKKLNQKNIKSKISALLKRFKAQDAGPSVGKRQPTAEELEEIFEELENISDSGPEINEPDKMSIISNPKPGLRPFFGSKTDILPPIEDRVQSDESPVETDEQEFSSDNENHPMFLSSVEFPMDSARSKSMGKRPAVPSTDNRASRSSSMKEKNRITHSATIESMGSANELKNFGVNSGTTTKKLASDMMAQLDDPTSFIASNIWLASSSDITWISKIDTTDFKTIRLIDCPNVSEVRTALQGVVGKIQKYCNNNSGAPPPQIIGILGGDRLVTNVLRVYVDLLQNKTNQEWLNYLRFTLFIPPNSIFGRSLSTVADGGLLENQWKALNKLIPTDTKAIEEQLHSAITAPSIRSLNIPIGEVMLQLYDTTSTGHHGSVTTAANNQDEKNSENESQVFIPFIAEIHLGNLEELNALHYVKAGGEEEKHGQTNFTSPSSAFASMSPPTSPQVNKVNDYKELQIEYWTASSSANHEIQHFQSSDKHYPSSMLSTPQQSKSGGGKFSMKASVRTLSIAREPLSTLLSMLFVKERKKDKVLQKLGRKTKPRSSDTFNSQSRVVSSVTRMICSGKNSPLEISIDGVTWNRIKFFQITSQWQTHVKFFPVSVPSSTTKDGR